MIIFRCIKISFHCNVYVHALSSILTYKQIEFEIVRGGGGGMNIRVNKPLLINASSKNVVIHVHLCYYNYLKHVHVQYMYSQERRSIGTGQRPPSQQCPKLQNITTLKFVIIYKGDI